MMTVWEAMEVLKEKGFDIKQAMEICADDADLYMEVLETALVEGKRKFHIIKDSISNQDYSRYHIEVHGLKNSARAIGAMELSELAKHQEQKVKSGNTDNLDTECGVLLKSYEEVLNTLEIIFGEQNCPSS